MLDEIRALEETSAKAWPPEFVQTIDGWRVRYTHGVSRRANSVLPITSRNNVPDKDRLALVEDFYKSRSSPTIYQISQVAEPDGLDATLAERGYSAEGTTLVQTAALQTVELRLPSNPSAPTLSATLKHEWCEAYAACAGEGSEQTKIRAGIWQRIAPSKRFGAIRHNGNIIAVGLGVIGHDWLGIFSMATHLEHRRQGWAQAIIGSLVSWATNSGARKIYLQVAADNLPAIKLYRSMGFHTAYQYHYRCFNPGV